MPLDFPSNPNLNDTYSYGGTTWIFNGTMWNKSSSATAALNLTTSNVIESANLYFTNARVYANVIGLVNTKANVTDLNTSNITEGNNLYFTNARSRSALIAGNGIGIAANGMVTAAVSSTAVTPANVSSQVNTDTAYFALPSGNTTQRPVSPANGFVRYNTSTGYGEIYNAIAGQWLQFGASPSINVEYLVVAGGGGGGTDIDVGGGGGGGGLLSNTVTVTTGTVYNITIGAGGSRGTGVDNTGTGGGSNGTNGGNSTVFSYTAIGGGYGATRNVSGGSGGSGGGGGDGATSGGAGIAGQGYNGGNGGGSGFNQNGGNDSGGGGGAGGAAVVWTPGPGLVNSISGSNVTYAAGGRGAQLITPTDGAANTGNGGTGARAGGSGIVILKYPATYTPIFSGGLTTSTVTSGGFKISTVTAGTGTVTFTIA